MLLSARRNTHGLFRRGPYVRLADAGRCARERTRALRVKMLKCAGQFHVLGRSQSQEKFAACLTTPANACEVWCSNAVRLMRSIE